MHAKFEGFRALLHASVGGVADELDGHLDLLRDEVISEIEILQSEKQKADMKINILLSELKKHENQIAKLQKMKFGPNKDRTPDNSGETPDQASDDSSEPLNDGPGVSDTKKKKKTPSNRNGRSKRVWAEHLERKEIYMGTDDKKCPCGCGGGIRDFDDIETLEIVPARYYIAVRKYPKYRCRKDDKIVGTKHLPVVFPKTKITHALLANAIMMRHGWHLPWYRQENIFRAQGIDMNRATLLRWSNRLATEALHPIYDLMRQELKDNSARLFIDETTIPKLAPGNGKTKTSQMFALLRDDRSFRGNLPPIVLYEQSNTRAIGKIEEILGGVSAIVQSDAYGGYGRFGKVGTPFENITPVKCWAHARRNFTDEYEFNKTPDAKQVVAIIKELYDEEAKIRGKPPLIREAHRKALAQPILNRLRQELIAMSPRHLAKGKMGLAIRYLLNRWDDFTRFVNDGRIDLDSNAVERMFKPTILERKGVLFIGSDEGGQAWAILSSIIETCKLNGINAEPYLKWMMDQIANKLPRSQYEKLLPWNAPTEFRFDLVNKVN